MAERHDSLLCSQSHASDSSPSYAKSMAGPIEGMEYVVATVSGYHGTERFNLIKLINHAGASYVGKMSGSITHLVCWKFEGRKYDIAMSSRTIVVNHRWIEDCIKQGKRVPEDHYTLQSGEEVGPLLLEVPQVPKHDVLVKNQKVLSNKTGTFDGSETQSGSVDFCLPRSSLLNENLLPGINKLGNSSHKSKRKLVKSTSEKALRSRSSLEELPLPRSRRNQFVESSSHSSMDLVRDKRKNFNNSGSTKPESSSKGRKRLVKKNKNREIVELLTSDSEQDSYPSRVNSGMDEHVIVLSDHVDRAMSDNVFGNGQNESLKADTANCISSSMDSDTRTANILTTTERISEDGCSGAENSKEETTERLDIKNDSEIPSLTELSCVICWTDFSSIRGVLPCGHRFCYSCIESWADQMASRRKMSTCPLCKTSFESILKLEDAATSDQKIYSQTIPCGLSKLDAFPLRVHETLNISAQVEQSESGPVCSVCRRLEPEDLLVACNLCEIRRIHSYCLDPPIDPWTCSDCKELQRLYLLSR